MIARKINNRCRPNADQSGLASIIVVMMLVVVISLISLGFSQLANRATRQSLGTNLSAAAEYAARSGVNDVIALLKGVENTKAEECNDLLKDGQPFEGAGSQLSGNETTRYTCILIDKKPTDIVYTNNEAYKSRVIAVSPTKEKNYIKSLMFSWQSASRNPPPVFPGPANAVPGDLKLYDETYWGQSHFAPMLRLGIYRSQPSGGKTRDSSIFLYPAKASSNNVTKINDSDIKDGALVPVACNSDTSNLSTGSFKGSADLDCNFIFDNLSTKEKFIYYLRLTPLYANADIKIKANDRNDDVIEFGGTQYVVDVTAKAGNAVKRLQARVSAPFSDLQYSLATPTDDLIPEYGIRTAGAICKRLQIYREARLALVEASPTVTAYCNFNVSLTPEEQGPPLTFTATSYSLPYKGDVTLEWDVEDDSAVTCTGTGGVWGEGTTLDTDRGKLKLRGLTTSVAYSIECLNAKNQSTTATVYIQVEPPPFPELQFFAENTSLPYDGKTTLKWTITNAPATWCWATGGPWGAGQAVPPADGSLKVGPLKESQTYTMQCGNNDPDYNDYHTPKITVTVQVAPKFPPPVLTFTVSNNPIDYNTKANLRWTIDAAKATWCYGWGSVWGADSTHGKFVPHNASNSESVGPFTTDQTFALQCGNNTPPNYNDVKTPVMSLVVKVKAKPKITVRMEGGDASDKVTGSGINCTNFGDSGDCVNEYDRATNLVLTPVAGSSTKFDNWDGPCTVNKQGRCTVNVDDNITVTAIFDKN